MRRTLAALVVVALVVAAAFALARLTAPGTPTAPGGRVAVEPGGPLAPGSTDAPGAPIGRRTKTSGCVAAGALPDPACTPGEVLTGDAAAVCVAGYAGSVRAVGTRTKNAVFAEYGVTSHPPGAYEVDHLVGLELGGSNGIANLWPEAAAGRPGFHEKDRVENALHRRVCAGEMALAEAQRAIATDWVAVYQGLP